MISDERIAVLVKQCRHVAEMFDELIPNTALDPFAHRRSINPFYNRTESGLYLEFYYGYPSRIWCPGGKWSFAGSTSTRGGESKAQKVAPFMNRLKTTIHQPEFYIADYGHVGPVYGIHEVDGGPVEPPGPVTHFTNLGSTADFTAACRAWSALTDGWV